MTFILLIAGILVEVWEPDGRLMGVYVFEGVYEVKRGRCDWLVTSEMNARREKSFLIMYP
jgi:hypothetical protein